MGGVISTVTGKATGGAKPKKENYEGKYSDELMTRILGSIDKYLDERGVRDYVPAGDRPRQWATTGSDRDTDNREDEEERRQRAAQSEQNDTIQPRKPSGTFGPLPALVDSLREERPEFNAMFQRPEEPRMLDMALSRAIESRRRGDELRQDDLKTRIADPAKEEQSRRRYMLSLRGGRSA